MNLTNIIIAGAFAVEGCSLVAKVSVASTPNTKTPIKTEVSSNPSSDAKDYAEYDTLYLGGLGFLRIGNEYVRFQHASYPEANNQLIVSDIPYFTLSGKSIYYYDDNGNDLKIEKVVDQTTGLALIYDSSVPEDQQYLAEAQKQFDTYLNKIIVRKEELRQETLTP